MTPIPALINAITSMGHSFCPPALASLVPGAQAEYERLAAELSRERSEHSEYLGERQKEFNRLVEELADERASSGQLLSDAKEAYREAATTCDSLREANQTTMRQLNELRGAHENLQQQLATEQRASDQLSTAHERLRVENARLTIELVAKPTLEAAIALLGGTIRANESLEVFHGGSSWHRVNLNLPKNGEKRIWDDWVHNAPLHKPAEAAALLAKPAESRPAASLQPQQLSEADARVLAEHGIEQPASDSPQPAESKPSFKHPAKSAVWTGDCDGTSYYATRDSNLQVCATFVQQDFISEWIRIGATSVSLHANEAMRRAAVWAEATPADHSGERETLESALRVANSSLNKGDHGIQQIKLRGDTLIDIDQGDGWTDVEIKRLAEMLTENKPICHARFPGTEDGTFACNQPSGHKGPHRHVCLGTVMRQWTQEQPTSVSQEHRADCNYCHKTFVLDKFGTLPQHRAAGSVSGISCPGTGMKPAPDSPQPGEQIPGPCTYCGSPDHWGPDCPRIPEDDAIENGPVTRRFVLRDGEPQPKLGDTLLVGGQDATTFTLYPIIKPDPKPTFPACRAYVCDTEIHPDSYSWVLMRDAVLELAQAAINEIT